MLELTDIENEYRRLLTEANYGAFDGNPISASQRLRLEELSLMLLDRTAPDFKAMARARPASRATAH